MAKKKQQTDNSQSPIENRQFIEIVNWKAAQPNMPNMGADWMKLYTSLLEHDGFAGLDDAARVLIVSLWLYAARSGLYILPADPDWIWRKIPMLNSEPDMGPLISARDVYGNPTPFLAYCRPPGQADNGRSQDDHPAAKPAAKKGKKKPGTAVATRMRGAQRDSKRVESREERREKREDATLSGCEREREREKKERVNSRRKQQQAKRGQKRRKTGQRQQTAKETAAKETAAAEPEKPENPTDSEAGAVKALHTMPKPPHSVTRGPQRLGTVIKARFPAHWQDPDAESFGWEMVRAIGLSDDRGNTESRSEAGAFAKWWFKAKRSAATMNLDELRSIAFKKARFVISRKAGKVKNPRALWTYIMDGELRSRGVNVPSLARASP